MPVGRPPFSTKCVFLPTGLGSCDFEARNGPLAMHVGASKFGRRMKVLSPTLGKVRIAQMLARARATSGSDDGGQDTEAGPVRG